MDVRGKTTNKIDETEPIKCVDTLETDTKGVSKNKDRLKCWVVHDNNKKILSNESTHKNDMLENLVLLRNYGEKEKMKAF